MMINKNILHVTTMNRKFILSAILAIGTMSVSAQTLPYQNPDLPFEERADDLLKRLTLEEKVKLMMDSSPAIERLGIPQFQWWNEALHGLGRNGFATVYPITMGMAQMHRTWVAHRKVTSKKWATTPRKRQTNMNCHHLHTMAQRTTNGCSAMGLPSILQRDMHKVLEVASPV